MDKLMTTKVSVPEGAREKVAEMLEQLVYDSVDLWSQIKTAHWNLRGSRFVYLHGFFDEIAGRVEKAADKVAERAVQLGCHSQGTVRESAKCSRIPDFGPAMYVQDKAVPALVRRVALYGGFLREGVKVAEANGDCVTENMLVGLLEKVDKDLWMLEATERS